MAGIEQTSTKHGEQGGHGENAAAHSRFLAHHFENQTQQFDAGKLGMWLFLVQEILFFSGLFCAYSIYRSNHPEIFVYADHFLDRKLGAINTGVLIFSSFTMAWAVRAAQLSQRRLCVGLLATTLLCACGFLGIKTVEYRHKFHDGLLWGRNYAPVVEGHEPEAPKSRSDEKVSDTGAADAAASKGKTGKDPSGGELVNKDGGQGGKPLEKEKSPERGPGTAIDKPAAADKLNSAPPKEAAAQATADAKGDGAQRADKAVKTQGPQAAPGTAAASAQNAPAAAAPAATPSNVLQPGPNEAPETRRIPRARR